MPDYNINRMIKIPWYNYLDLIQDYIKIRVIGFIGHKEQSSVIVSVKESPTLLFA